MVIFVNWLVRRVPVPIDFVFVLFHIPDNAPRLPRYVYLVSAQDVEAVLDRVRAFGRWYDVKPATLDFLNRLRLGAVGHDKPVARYSLGLAAVCDFGIGKPRFLYPLINPKVAMSEPYFFQGGGVVGKFKVKPESLHLAIH